MEWRFLAHIAVDTAFSLRGTKTIAGPDLWIFESEIVVTIFTSNDAKDMIPNQPLNDEERSVS